MGMHGNALNDPEQSYLRAGIPMSTVLLFYGLHALTIGMRQEYP